MSSQEPPLNACNTCSTSAAWDPLELDEARVKRLLELHPVTGGILIFDDTGLPKKGTASVGVAPQYSGTLGKIGN